MLVYQRVLIDYRVYKMVIFQEATWQPLWKAAKHAVKHAVSLSQVFMPSVLVTNYIQLPSFYILLVLFRSI